MYVVYVYGRLGSQTLMLGMCRPGDVPEMQARSEWTGNGFTSVVTSRDVFPFVPLLSDLQKRR